MTGANEPRTINPNVGKYLQKVNAAMNASYGVSYSDVHADLHKNYDKMRKAFDDGISAEDFAAETASESGLKPASPGFGASEARAYNMRQAALVNYADETPGWTVGQDGIYANSAAGVVQFKPDYDISAARWEFAISVAQGSTLDASPVMPKGESFLLELVTRDQDISPALDYLLEQHPEYGNIDPGAEPEAGPSSFSL